MVIKNKERLRNCQGQAEPQETGPAIGWHPRWNPVTENSHPLTPVVEGYAVCVCVCVCVCPRVVGGTGWVAGLRRIKTTLCEIN